MKTKYNIIKRAGLVLIVVFLISFVSAATYYVDATGGNDGNDGFSEANAWQTISKVNSMSFSPGDNILFKRGEIWREQLVIPSSGVAGNPITFGAYGSGEKPIISAFNLLGSGWSESGGNRWQRTLITEPHTVYFDGEIGALVSGVAEVNSTKEWFWSENVFYVYSIGNPVTVYTNPGIEVSQRDCAILNTNRDYIIFENLHIKGNNEDSMYAASLYIGFTSDNNEIDNCTIEWSWQSGIVIEGGNDNKIHDCVLQNNANDGIWITYGGDGTKIYNNTFSGNGFATSGDRENLGVWNSANVTIYNNKFFHVPYSFNTEIGSDDGSTIGIKFYKNYIDDSLGTRRAILTYYSEIDIYYNIIIGHSGNDDEAIFLAGIDDAYPLKATVYNNVVYSAAEGVEIYDEGFIHTDTNITVKNNMIINSITRHMKLDSAVAAKSTIDYNYYYPDAGTKFRYARTNYNFSDWKTNSGQDSNSITSDPLFIDLLGGNFHLQSTSPAIDAGIDVGLTQDFDGNPIVGIPDIGAYEYQGIISTCSSGADANPMDGIVSMTELMSYITIWKFGGITMNELMTAIGEWKNGC